VEIFSPELMISEGSLAFIGIVMENEGLFGWRVNIWGCWGEGECDGDMKEICIGQCSTDVRFKMLFLHEVAHALVNTEMREWHSAKWLEEYQSLCGKYLVGVPLEVSV